MTHLKSKITIILLAFLVGIEGVTYLEMRSQYDGIRSSYLELSREFSALEKQYSELGQDYDNLESKYSILQESRTILPDSSSFIEQYINLRGEYVSEREYIMALESYVSLLTESYINLRKDYEKEAVLRIGNSLESFYDLLRYNVGLTVSHWIDLQREADFCAKLALHDLGRNCWPDIEGKFAGTTKTYSYEIAKWKMAEIISIIGLQKYHTPTYKIKKILQFIHENIHYEDELDNTYLAPIETLTLKSGDCDDFSILASALFEAVGIDSAFGIFKNAEGEYHCMVLVHLEDLPGYTYSSYLDLTNRNLDEGRWIIIEPQNTIDQQDSDWINTFSLVAVSPLDWNL